MKNEKVIETRAVGVLGGGHRRPYSDRQSPHTHGCGLTSASRLFCSDHALTRTCSASNACYEVSELIVSIESSLG